MQSEMVPDHPPLSLLGWDDRWSALLAQLNDPALRPGRVFRRDRGVALVMSGNGPVSVSTRTHPDVVTGDWVALAGDQLIAVLARRGALRRQGPDGVEQLLAANVDVVVLVCGLDRPVKSGRIERAAVQAWDAGATPLVVLNKSDLGADIETVVGDLLRHVPGLTVMAASSGSGQGIEELRQRLAGSTSVLVGESGAGKSSLLNALAGTQLAAQGEVRPGDAKGRHTTTRRELHLLAGPVVVIDTPGTRSFGLAADDQAVEATFTDVQALATGCRFRNCRHAEEPGCAVRLGVEQGSLSSQRLESFRRLQHELTSEDLRARPHERRRFERSFARQVRTGQRIKGDG